MYKMLLSYTMVVGVYRSPTLVTVVALCSNCLPYISYYIADMYVTESKYQNLAYKVLNYSMYMISIHNNPKMFLNVIVVNNLLVLSSVHYN